MSDFPKVVGLDTEYTIWQGLLYTNWGAGKGAFAIQEDNIERVDRWLLRDKTNSKNWIRVSEDISKIINHILKNGAQLAIISGQPTSHKAMTDRALYYFNAHDPKDGKEWSIIDLVTYNEVKPESKAQHWRRIREWSGRDYSEMLMFDDVGTNNLVRVELGVSFQLVRGLEALNWDTYLRGLKAWQGAKKLAILANPSHVPNRVLLGYSGLPPFWIDLLRIGEGLVDTSTPYRWGYALYVAASLTIAKFFRDWNDNYMKDKSFVCEVWVKDYDAWVNANKVWVPENDGNLPQTSTITATAEETGNNQEDRDLFIGDNWHTPMPYVLFSQHHWFGGMPPPERRWTEMVVYTQIYRTLFDVIPLADSDLKNVTILEPFPFGKQFKSWNIFLPPETRAEFLRYGETDLYNLST
ncbi:acid phosphatase-domain-containing protein [Crepidotus variabilis]|uniref:Acid phosphatase-domain-containing protein n=1 Tax=Crepidotus variabilis TaxID=179855 RepID=A0A9P6E986_9AGAR|nr:acid phosphatase-domain-containing protein [Crepidotus variabilis]